MSGSEDWRKNADTHNMSSENVKRAGVEGSKRPPGQNPGSVLHQRGKMPYSPTTMVIIGLAITGSIFFLSLYSKKKPEVSAMDVAKVTTNTADPQDTRPRS